MSTPEGIAAKHYGTVATSQDVQAIKDAMRSERERIIGILGTAFLNYTAHDSEKRLFMAGTDNIRRALEVCTCSLEETSLCAVHGR